VISPNYPNLPFVIISAFESPTLEERLDSIPMRKITHETARELDGMIADAERYPVGSIYFHKLMAYRLQCCESNVHRFGDWTPGQFVPRGNYEPGLRATEERRKCIYCSHTEQRPVFEPVPAFPGF
jgi:hypothetical protein